MNIMQTINALPASTNSAEGIFGDVGIAATPARTPATSMLEAADPLADSAEFLPDFAMSPLAIPNANATLFGKGANPVGSEALAAPRPLAEVFAPVIQQLVTLIQQLMQYILAQQSKIDTGSAAQGAQSPDGIKPSVLTPSSATDSFDTSKIYTKAPPGFLWKPISDSDGKLAILVPPGLSHAVETVRILDRNGEKSLSEGKFSGLGNGDRAHFRFSQAGGHYPDGAIVEIEIGHGDSLRVRIPDSAKRFE